MIILGGDNTGGHYNPATDTWTPTKSLGDSISRGAFTAIWTGTEMIVWGGQVGNNTFNTGGVYNLASRLTLSAANQIFAATGGAGTVNVASPGSCIWTATSNADFSATELAAEAIVAAFGSNLAATTQAASTVPLPTTLAGTRVTVQDSAGVTRDAPLFFVSPNQVNYLLPLGTANGAATVTISSNNGNLALGTVQIATVAPGLFTANASGQGVPAAVALRVRGDGTQSFEPVAQFDSGANRFVPAPIDLGANTDQVVLLLFGTGIRGRSNLSAVACRIGGVEVPVSFAGAQGDLVGLDQINVGPLPRNLAGRGEVDLVLMVDGKTANTVRISVR
jgi:uncharacterized protein (TIGR03437 family)